MAMVMSRSITRFFAHPGPNSPERMADAASGRDALSRWDHAHRRNERAPFRNVGLNKMRQSLDSLTASLPLLVRPHLAHFRGGFDKCSFNRAVLPPFLLIAWQ